MNWNKKEVLIVGGTGSLGKALTKELLANHHPKGIRIFSRDELKQGEMRQEIKNDYAKRHDLTRSVSDREIPISYLIGDIRDRKRIELATKETNIIVHCAALKQVPGCELNPMEAIKTNILGSQNVLLAALENNNTVEKVMAISTDKAVYPINLYGATKLCMERLFIDGNVYSGGRQPRFSCCRYGNVLGSRGSIVPLFRKQYKENKKVTITDPRMTRFWITLERVAKFIIQSIEDMHGSEIFIPKMPSASIWNILEASLPEGYQAEIEECGIRPGEKLHETLITKEESIRVFENDDRFKIIQDEILPAKQFEYRSDTNAQWLTVEEIRKMIG